MQRRCRRIVSGIQVRSYWGSVHQQQLDSENILPPAFLKSPKTVSIIGAPMSFGQPLTGCDLGPTLLRKDGLRNSLAALHWRVEDQGESTFVLFLTYIHAYNLHVY